jgi:hypothetical protein
LYGDRGNLYRARQTVVRADGTVRDHEILTTPTYSDVPFFWERKQDATAPVPLGAPGRSPQDNIFTQDIFHFSLTVVVAGVEQPLEMGQGWWLHVTTSSGGIDDGAWFQFQGEATVLGWRSNSQWIMGKKGVAPLRVGA